MFTLKHYYEHVVKISRRRLFSVYFLLEGARGESGGENKRQMRRAAPSIVAALPPGVRCPHQPPPALSPLSRTVATTRYYGCSTPVHARVLNSARYSDRFP
ncbi:unnamed protein product [Colias eurytheme]|nr:unnamed protein product [Colias eurytheme]